MESGRPSKPVPKNKKHKRQRSGRQGSGARLRKMIEKHMMKVMRKEQINYRNNCRVLTEVQVAPAPVIKTGPVLYGAPVPAEQHLVQQQQPPPLPMAQLPPPVAQPRPPVVPPRPPVAHPPPPVPQPPPPVAQQTHYWSLTTAAATLEAMPQVSATLANDMPQPPPSVAQPPPPAMVQPPPPGEQQTDSCSLTTAAAPLEAMPQVSATLENDGIEKEFMELNSSNAAKFVTHHSDILMGCSPSHWHQITIKTPIMENKRKFVILAINKQLSPLKLNPYFFRMENNHITFFVNMCGMALKTLCRRDLKVPYISDKFVEIEMTVKLFMKNFNLSEIVEEIVLRRLDSQNKFLDLSYINSIPEVREILFHPTDTWHILDQLLRTAQIMAPGLTALSLAGNGITSLNLLWDFLVYSKWKSLQTLDLSDNEIQTTCVGPLSRSLQISELYLDRNPICKMHNRGPYISAIRVTFPHLIKLDGTYLHTTACLPFWKPNFIVGSAGDSGDFVDQFIEHFFTLYDDADRMKLRGLYHNNACFSLRCLCLDAQSTTPNSRLTAYLANTRNLLRCSDMRKVRAALTCGSENIIERLSNLPKTQHDPYTFAVDLTVHTPKMTVLTVTGVFRDITKETSSHRHFSRTFVIVGRGNSEYQITNDILYISNATTREAMEAFKFVRPPRTLKKYQPNPNLSEFEKESMTRMVQQLTSMSAPWSRKCLEDTDWDLKEALKSFVELHETSKIPKSAFVS